MNYSSLEVPCINEDKEELTEKIYIPVLSQNIQKIWGIYISKFIPEFEMILWNLSENVSATIKDSNNKEYIYYGNNCKISERQLY